MPNFAVVAATPLHEGLGYAVITAATPLLALASWINEMTEPEVQALGFPSRAQMQRALRRDPPTSAAPHAAGVWSTSIRYRRTYYYLVAVRVAPSAKARRS
jgi:hypothetical protein